MVTLIFHSSVSGVNASPVVDYHSSIIIDGNAELDTFCAGNGTSGNETSPHRIEDFEIAWDGPQNGFILINIDRHMLI